MPRYVNSVDKIVFSYMAAVCKEPFTYGEHEIIPRALQVSPCIFRGFKCPAMCGGCCPRFSLEYLPSESRPVTEHPIFAYTIKVNDKDVTLYHDPQTDHDDHFCRCLTKEDARCLIHSRRPFHCDFELIRVFISEKKKQNRLSQQLFGRAWQFLRIDGQRGALCEITEPSTDTINEVVRKLKRLKEWCDHFGIVTWLDEIIKWTASGPHTKPLILCTKQQLEDMIEIKDE